MHRPTVPERGLKAHHNPFFVAFFFLGGQPQESSSSRGIVLEISAEGVACPIEALDEGRDFSKRPSGAAAGPGLHGSPLLHAWIQSLIPASSVLRVGDRTFCRTDPTSTTSSKSMRRASSRLSGSGLSHNSKRAGSTHSPIAYLRAKMSRRKGLGGFRQRMARSRMLAKPHREERSRIEDHSSNERSSRVLKFLREGTKINHTPGVDSDIRTADIKWTGKRRSPRI